MPSRQRLSDVAAAVAAREPGLVERVAAVADPADDRTPPPGEARVDGGVWATGTAGYLTGAPSYP